MNGRSALPLTLPIAAVERDTGLSKDSLRVWERRYGFPSPERDWQGERAYSIEQVEKLRLVKRLLDAGHRPGRIVRLSVEALQQLTEQTLDVPLRAAAAALDSADLRTCLAVIRGHDVPALRAELTRRLVRCGVGPFVTDVVAPLNVAVGDAWVRGQLEIFEEHTYIEVVQTVLRHAISSIPALSAELTAAAPRVLLSTFPGERHGVGLLMVEALLTLEGCQCVPLGVYTPIWDVALAAKAHRSQIIALSFTACMNPNQIIDGLTELRGKLPASVDVWVGGSAPVLYRRSVPGVRAVGSLDELLLELQRWRQRVEQV